MQYVRIPEERVKVLIGEGGKTKRLLESRMKCKIKVEGNEVSVEGEPYAEWIGKDLVQAIGRGFNPEKALSLLQENSGFVLIDLDDFATTSKSIQTRRGRVIGEDGRTRKFIERTTGAFISVYGDTVGILGSFDSVEIAKKAVLMLVSGSNHSTVYRYLEKNRGKTE